MLQIGKELEISYKDSEQYINYAQKVIAKSQKVIANQITY